MELPSALVITIFGVCFREIAGNIVNLTPSPLAIANDGVTLALQCDYSGSFTLLTVNWYLNGKPFGLVLSANDCRFQSIPSVYEIFRYYTQCNSPRFSLLITNITKDQDDNDIWECDTTPIATRPPSKVSTRIQVMEQTTTTTFTAGLRISAPAEETGTIIIVGFRAGIVFVLLMIVTIFGIICLCCYLYHNWNEQRKQIDRIDLEESNAQPPEIHTGTTSVLRRALPNLGGGIDDKPIARPHHPPTENSDDKDQSWRGLTAIFDDKQSLATEKENYSEEPKKEK